MQSITETKKNVIKKEFQTKHQLLAWKQYATIEHKWYEILDMDVKSKTLFVERLFETDKCKFNNKVLNLVRASFSSATATQKEGK